MENVLELEYWRRIARFFSTCFFGQVDKDFPQMSQINADFKTCPQITGIAPAAFKYERIDLRESPERAGMICVICGKLNRILPVATGFLDSPYQRM